MFNKIKKNLIHFSSDGSNVTEDFVAARREKTNKFRKVIRICFYVHCAAALLCTGISLVFGSDNAAVVITLAALVCAWLSFFAAGNSMPPKILLFVLDFAVGAGFIVWGAVHGKNAVYTACGIMLCIVGVLACASFIAALCRQFLEEIQPRDIRRTDYTRFDDDVIGYIENPDNQSDEMPTLPPLTSDMRLLADKLRNIICNDDEEKF